MNKLFTAASGALAMLSLAAMLHSCSQPQPEQPKLSAQLLKEQHQDTKRIKKRDERGIKHAAYWMEAMKVNPLTGTIDVRDIYNARNQAYQMRHSGNNRQGLNLLWENLGPDNVGGRTRGFMIDRNNTNYLLAGSVTGGLFVSTDGALSWTEHPDNDKFLSNSISSIMQARNGDIYIGTGETFVYTMQNTVGHIGGGIYKSTDGGTTFALLAATTPQPNNTTDTWAYVSELATHPNDPNTVYAATRGGLRYSIDGGTSWTAVQGIAAADNGRESRDVHVNNQGIVFAEINKKYYRSTDGATFQLVSGTNGFPATNVSRIEFAVSPQDANYVYAAIANGSGGLRGIYRSIDAGITWTPYSQENSTVFNPLGQQGEYDLAFAVSPHNKEELVIGGQLELWKGGLNVGWNMVAYWTPESPTNPYYVHADMHTIAFDPTDPNIMYVCTDGGVHKSLNASQQFPTFTPRNKNYITTQFYHMAAGLTGEIMAGAQDNGTVYIDYKGNTVFSGLDVRGGDGGYCAISQLEPNIIFSEVQFGALARSLNRGQSFGGVWDDYARSLGAGGQSFSSFIAPYDLWEERVERIDSIVADPVTGDADTFRSFKNLGYLIFGAAGRVMITPDALEVGGIYWFSAPVSGVVSAVTAAVDGSVYIGTTAGNLYRITGLNTATYNRANNTATGLTVALVRGSNQWTGTTAKYISGVGVDPQDPGHIVVTFGGYGTNINIFEGENVDSPSPTFTGIQGNLPKMPVYAAIAGTDFGLWSSTDGGATWQQELAGLFNTPIYSVEQQGLYNDDCYVIYVASYGRGMFRSTTLTQQNNPACQLVSGILPNKPTSQNKLNLYPNPVADKLYFDLTLAKTGKVSVKVVDLLGRQMLQQDLGNQSTENVKFNIDLSALPNGVYVVAIETPLGLDTRQIVVSK